MEIHKNELTTGILVLVTLGILTAVLVVIGMPGVLKPMNTYRIYYDNANGIRPGAPVLLGGREIGKVISLDSPVPMDKRPKDHPNYEVSIDVQVAKEAPIYHNVTVRLTQQGLMGQQVIDFVQGDVNTGLAEDRTEFVGQRVPDISEAMSDNMTRLTGPESDLAATINNMTRLTGPESDLAATIKSTKAFVGTLNNAPITEVIQNAAEFTSVLKKEPWRLLWPGGSKPPTREEAKEEEKPKVREEVKEVEKPKESDRRKKATPRPTPRQPSHSRRTG